MRLSLLAAACAVVFTTAAQATPINPGQTISGVSVPGTMSVYEIFGHAGNPGGDWGAGPTTPAAVFTFGSGTGRVFSFSATGLVSCCSDAPNIPGAIAGAVIGGVLGHQVGGGRGKDVATVGGAVAGAAIGANVGRGGTQVYSQDVERCVRVERDARPAYWDVTYRFRGLVHRAQLSTPPGPTITVNLNGEPRV